MRLARQYLVSFCVVNDLAKALPDAICDWRLEGGMGDIASATFPVDIPADSISPETKLTLPSLGTGDIQAIRHSLHRENTRSVKTGTN